MSKEETLVRAGPAAIIRAIAEDDALSVDAMAMACSRRARAEHASREVALQWARACIACYRKAAEARAPGYDRQGSEVPAFGLRVLMILRWGAEEGHFVLDPDDVHRWLQELIGVLPSPAAMREALGRVDGSAEMDRAICLKERLQIGLPLFKRGYFPVALVPWFKEVGVVVDGY